MKKISAIAACACLAFLAGCCSPKLTRTDANQKPFMAFSSDTFYVTVENFGNEGGRDYKQSPDNLGRMIERELLKHTSHVKRQTGTVDFEQAKADAKKDGYKYLVSTKIVTWHLVPMGFDRTNDQVNVVTRIWNTEKDVLEDSFTINAKGSVITRGNESPSSTIRSVYADYFDDMFKK